MKIGFLLGMLDDDIDALKRGDDGSYFLCNLYRQYSSLGHDVVVITMHRNIKKDFRTEYNKHLVVHGLAPLKHGNISAFLMFSYEIKKIKHVLHRENVDVIHAHWCYEYAMAALLENSDRTVITLHDWPDVVCPLIGNFYWKQRQKLGNFVLKKAKVVTAVSYYTAGFYKNRFPNRKIIIIPNFIKETTQSDPKEKKDYLRLVSINNGFSQRKNVGILIKAFEIVREKMPDARLSLLGSGYEEKGEAYQWALENSDITNISFEGLKTRTETLQILHKSDILVHPSIEESFGMTLIEAMQQKVFVIGGKDSGAVPWVLGYGKYGSLVDVTKPEEIADAVMNACSNYESTKSMVEDAFTYVNSTFTINNVANSYLKLYSDMIKN